MNQEKIPASKELQGADAALRRAAHTAKRLAEQNGTPYVIAKKFTCEQPLKNTNDVDKNNTSNV